MAGLLGERRFLGGDRPCAEDASLFATMENLLNNPVPTPLRDSVLAHPNLVEHVRHIRTEYFRDILPEDASFQDEPMPGRVKRNRGVNEFLRHRQPTEEGSDVAAEDQVTVN